MSSFPRPLRAVIFDLDGVLTDTARAHYRAWKRLADELGIPFDEHDNERLKGVDRMGSLALILAKGDRDHSDAERAGYAERKNRWYVDEVEGFTPADLFPGSLDALHAIRSAGLKTALASASRNAPALIAKLGIADCFDAVADPAAVAAGKPAPDIFLAAAALIGAPPADCLGVEDAPAGIRAIKSAGMPALGIGDPALLPGADRVIPAIADFRLGDYHVG